METSVTPSWFSCEVLSLDNLGAGFRVGGYAYARKGNNDRVLVFNSAYAPRVLTREQAKKSLRLVRRMDEDRSAKLERDYWWEVHR